MPDEPMSTSKLLEGIFKTESIQKFIRRNSGHMVLEPFKMRINRMCASKGMVPERIIAKAGIERTYGHQIFNGLRNPSRDKVLQLAVGFGLGYDEAQALLKIAGKSSLYPKVDRDAVVIFSLERKLEITDVQAILEELSLPLLGTEDRYGR
ncbi:MAG: hypothetical protein LBC41_07195 [Clostridiales bacterium]|jgi:transcriptional regulator with XRE-family HTH domain|nr:hypothetical protein [Clostridiales bacterium]